MEAIRSVLKLKNHKVQITLPKSFNEDYVEVIILPFKSNNVDTTDFKKIELQKLLLEAPTMSDDDYDSFQEKRKHFNKWNS